MTDLENVQDVHPKKEIHFNLTTAQANGKVSEANTYNQSQHTVNIYNNL